MIIQPVHQQVLLNYLNNKINIFRNLNLKKVKTKELYILLKNYYISNKNQTKKQILKSLMNKVKKVMMMMKQKLQIKKDFNIFCQIDINPSDIIFFKYIYQVYCKLN